MKKSLLSILIIICMCILPLASCGGSGGMEFTLNSDGVSYMLASAKNKSSVTVPDTYKDLPVTAISNSAFEDCTSLKSVTLPSSLKTIDARAFAGCTALTSVTIPDSVYEIGGAAFSGCTALATITLPTHGIEIGENAFMDTAYAKNTSNWKDGILYLGDHLLMTENKTAISGTFEIKEGVKSVAGGTFSNCSGLTAIVMPDSVTHVGDFAFSYNRSLSTVTLSANLTNISEGMFKECTGLKTVNIPESVKSIGSEAFYKTNVTTFTLPDTIEWIGASAFVFTPQYTAYNNSSQKDLYIGKYLIKVAKSTNGEYTVREGTVAIADNALEGCASVTAINLPDTLTSISDYAFYGCSGITSITLPAGIKSIGAMAFNGCNKLTEITVPEGVKYIGVLAFQSCTALTKISLPKSLQSIDYGAFNLCSALTEVNYAGSEDEWNKIGIDYSNVMGNNEALKNATVNYNK